MNILTKDQIIELINIRLASARPQLTAQLFTELTGREAEVNNSGDIEVKDY